jgi:CheY-like chemotaxis protein
VAVSGARAAVGADAAHWSNSYGRRGRWADLGYEVQEAPHGEAALAVLDRFDPDLLIIDFAMPGMNGAETAQAMRRRNARLPILFLSGFADSAALEAAVGEAPILRKPFRPFELAAAVRTALDASHSTLDRQLRASNDER